MKKGEGSTGMTLLEVLIALFVFSVVMVAANTLLATFLNARVNMKNITAATSTANKMLEQIRLTPYDNIKADTIELPKFWCAWAVEVDNTISMKKVLLTVKWPPDLKRRNHAINLSTIVSK